ncbi:lasso peptide biosynthesis B2 protein [Nocardiopsis sp. HUAS JQ3]|uniref:lasso peptide biosynthesis B2 protein n=1 Tax=Nocardiopsis sp. HUAS JQ3 TaxID=3061629 RepID=UPI00266D47CD|nr:lasso peptide biosynthesis B2 protein [Nocardiopsis sp. HUAS JQ3]
MRDVLPEVPVRPNLPSRLLIRLIVPATQALSRRMSPQQLRRFLSRLAAGARPASYDEAKRARDHILTQSPLCRGGTACLTRSISVVLLCRIRGVWPTWCVGVIAAPPFAAHAWIEAEGRMVDEPVDSSFYRTFFTVPADPDAPASAEHPGRHQNLHIAGNEERNTG